MRLTVTTAPAEEPVTLTEIKAHLRITGTDDDTDLAIYLQMAREQAETFCRRAIITQTLTLRRAAFPTLGWMDLPRPKLASVSSVKYYNESNVLTTVSSSTVYDAICDDLVGRIELRDGQDWPTDVYARSDAVEIIYVAGYGAAAAVPAALKIAIRELAAQHYENRVPVVTGTIATSLPMHVESLLWAHRVFSF